MYSLSAYSTDTQRLTIDNRSHILASIIINLLMILIIPNCDGYRHVGTRFRATSEHAIRHHRGMFTFV